MRIIRWIGILIGALVLLAILLGATTMLLSESGEVVVLRTLDAAGEPHETRLWVVEYYGAEWLRAGEAESGWFRRLSANPGVVLVRNGRERSFRAVPVRDPATLDRINALMNEKYGLPDTLIGAALRDDGASVPVRLDPS
jgi:hypothetical protein